MFVNSDFSDLLRLFNANGRWIPDGGWLGRVREDTEQRYTADLAPVRPQDLIDVQNSGGVGEDGL